jgi:spore germination protein GerM
MARGKRGPRLGKTGCLFWILILIVIVIVVLYRSKGSFRDTFKSLKVFGEKTAEVTQKQAPKTDEAPKPEIVNEDTALSGPVGAAENPAEEEPVSATPPEKTPKATADAQKPVETKTVRTKSIEATVYFVTINENDGSAKPFGVKRTVQFKDSPITRTLETLLDGVSQSEKNTGVISFIPRETKLISAGIKNGHLTVDFSGELEDNYSGRAAILLELSQILLTCFSFDTVQKVTIMIDGTHKGYITGEGVPLEPYYTRQDLSRLVSGG